MSSHAEYIRKAVDRFYKEREEREQREAEAAAASPIGQAQQAALDRIAAERAEAAAFDAEIAAYRAEREAEEQRAYKESLGAKSREKLWDMAEKSAPTGVHLPPAPDVSRLKGTPLHEMSKDELNALADATDPRRGRR